MHYIDNEKNLIRHNMDSYVALNSICTVKWDKTLSLCGVNSFIFFVEVSAN